MANMDINRNRHTQAIEVSKGVRLTPLNVADADTLFALVDANRRHLRMWLPWLDSARCVEDTRAFIRTCETQASRNEGVQFAVRVDNDIAGVIGHRIDWPNRHASLGYWLGEACQGRGLATTACRSLVKHAFDVLQLNRVEIRCAVRNLRSCAIPRRLGFREEGVLREAQWLYDHFVDHVVYGMLASDWRRANLGI